MNSKNINNSQLEKLKQKVKDSGIYFSYKKYFGLSSLEKSENKVDCDYSLFLSEYLENK
ncbi:MAG: hypothetical protein Q9M97_08805 [Candidatus Gracilibacteria bacterium]|nr:hypothetical protein [Candidatus Gracilibacteria bacterium]